MFISKMSLPRRTFLRGMGATLALPLLDAMVPALSALSSHRREAGPPARVRLRPQRRDSGPVGAGDRRRRLRAVADAPPARARAEQAARAERTWRSEQAESFGDGNGDHARGTRVVVERRAPEAHRRRGHPGRARRSIRSPPPIWASRRRLPSLELALEAQERSLGSCDNGYACVYINTISWRTPTSPVPMEIHPRIVFDRLFGDGGNGTQRLAQVREVGEHPRFSASGSGAAAADRSAARRSQPRSPSTWTPCARSSSGFSAPSSRPAS